MSDIPYVNTLGNIQKYFERIRQAKTPENRFTHEFLKDTLNFKSGNDRKLITLLKNMKFLDDSGNPLQLYREFRSETTFPSKAIATGIKNGFAAIFARNENAFGLGEDEIKGHVLAVTGDTESNSLVRLRTQTFVTLAKLADTSEIKSEKEPIENKQLPKLYEAAVTNQIPLTHTIVLNLPTTTTKEVYDTIFRSLKENLLNK